PLNAGFLRPLFVTIHASRQSQPPWHRPTIGATAISSPVSTIAPAHRLFGNAASGYYHHALADCGFPARVVYRLGIWRNHGYRRLQRWVHDPGLGELPSRRGY